MGMSICMPFFGMAHVYAKASDYDVDGYSMPIGSHWFLVLFLCSGGITFLKKTLKHFLMKG